MQERQDENRDKRHMTEMDVGSKQICVDLLCCTSRGRCTVATQSKYQLHACICLKQIPEKANKLILSYLKETMTMRNLFQWNEGLHIGLIA